MNKLTISIRLKSDQFEKDAKSILDILDALDETCTAHHLEFDNGKDAIVAYKESNTKDGSPFTIVYTRGENS